MEQINSKKRKYYIDKRGYYIETEEEPIFIYCPYIPVVLHTIIYRKERKPQKNEKTQSKLRLNRI